MSKVYCRVYQAKNKKLIANRIEVANSFFQRLRGLLGRKSLQAGDGLLLQPCSSIHCFGMHFAIDALFLDRQNRVLSIHGNMLPGSHAFQHQAHSVLELCAGEAQKYKIQIGDQLLLSFTSSKDVAS